jgi:hypothetical protein
MVTELQEQHRQIVINGKPLDHSSVEMDDVHGHDYPDFSDAYVKHATFHDGTELNDKEYNELHDKHADFVNAMAHEHYHNSR